MNETKANMQNQATPVEQSGGATKKLRGENGPNGQSVEGKVVEFFTKQFRGKLKRRVERILQGHHFKEWERVGNTGATTNGKRRGN